MCFLTLAQDPDNINIGCDPEDYPTADYIATCVLFSASMRCILKLFEATRVHIPILIIQHGPTITARQFPRTPWWTDAKWDILGSCQDFINSVLSAVRIFCLIIAYSYARRTVITLQFFT